MSQVIAAKFQIEDQPPRVHKFEVNSTKDEAVVAELKTLIAGEWKCKPVDVKILHVGESESEFREAPPEVKKLPTPAQVKGMKRSNLEILAKELEIDADLDSIKREDLNEIVNKKIADLQGTSAPTE